MTDSPRTRRQDALEAALREIAGDEIGMGIHLPCCARGQRIARAALAAMSVSEPCAPCNEADTRVGESLAERCPYCGNFGNLPHDHSRGDSLRERTE